MCINFRLPIKSGTLFVLIIRCWSLRVIQNFFDNIICIDQKHLFFNFILLSVFTCRFSSAVWCLLVECSSSVWMFIFSYFQCVITAIRLDVYHLLSRHIFFQYKIKIFHPFGCLYSFQTDLFTFNFLQRYMLFHPFGCLSSF